MKHQELEEHLLKLAEITAEKYAEVEHLGVLAGQSGIAMFHFYCAKYFDDDRFSETGVEIISSCIEKINEGYSYPTYCTGIAGFGWVLQHLLDEGFIDLDLDELLSPFDIYLKSQMRLDLENDFFDFLHGAMGYGFYFLKRMLSEHTSEEIKQKYTLYLEELIDGLERMSKKDAGGLWWDSILNKEQNNRGINLSFSHGMSSIVYILSRFYFAGISQSRIKTILGQVPSFLIKQKNPGKDGISLFPSWIELNKPLEYKSRLAWCYGDLGISFALQWLSKILNDNELSVMAEKILIHSSQRTEPELSLVKDTGFCHGSFGNAQIFRVTGLHTKQKKLQEVADFWMKDGLAQYTGSPEEPFKQWVAPDKSWRMELNLLEGLSGIGLVLIDHLSDSPNNWDECLMLR